MNRRRFLKYAGATATVVGASALGLDRVLNSNELISPGTTATQLPKHYLETNLNEIDPHLSRLIPALDTLRRFPESHYSSSDNLVDLKGALEGYLNGLDLLKQRLENLSKGIEAGREEWNRIHGGPSSSYDGMNWVGYKRRNAVIEELKRVSANTDRQHILAAFPPLHDSVRSIQETKDIIETDSFVRRNLEFNREIAKRYSYLTGIENFSPLDVPGNSGQAVANTARAEVSRQLGVQFEGSINTSVDKGAYAELLETMGMEHGPSFREIIQGDSSPMKYVELAHIVNVSRTARRAVADTLVNGIDTGVLQNVHLASHLVGPQVTAVHVGTIEDRFYGYPDEANYSLIPPNHLRMSELELAIEIMRRIPEFGYVTGNTSVPLYSSRDVWQSGKWNSEFAPIIFNIAMLSAGRLVFALGEYTLLKPRGIPFLGHTTNVIPSRGKLYRTQAWFLRGAALPEPLEQYAKHPFGNPNGNFLQGFYPFLSGSLTLFTYDPFTRKFTSLNDTNLGYNFEIPS